MNLVLVECREVRKACEVDVADHRITCSRDRLELQQAAAQNLMLTDHDLFFAVVVFEVAAHDSAVASCWVYNREPVDHLEGVLRARCSQLAVYHLCKLKEQVFLLLLLLQFCTYLLERAVLARLFFDRLEKGYDVCGLLFGSQAHLLNHICLWKQNV